MVANQKKECIFVKKTMKRFIQLMARRERLIELNSKNHYTQGYKIDKYLNCLLTIRKELATL